MKICIEQKEEDNNCISSLETPGQICCLVLKKSLESQLQKSNHENEL